MDAGPAREVVRLVDVRDEALDVGEVLAAVADPGAGGTGLFVGTVRDHDAGRGVLGLGYEAHPAAAQVLRAESGRCAAEHPAVRALAVLHRHGELAVGDVAVVVAAAAAHRAEALAACADLVERVKHAVPVWKVQHLADGRDEWVDGA